MVRFRTAACCRAFNKFNASGLEPLQNKSLFVSFTASFADSSVGFICGVCFLLRSSVGLRSTGSGRRLVATMASNSVAEEPVVERAGIEEVDAGSADESLDATYGFTRLEMMNKKPLVGSVDLYERHIFLRYNQPSSWPSKVEASDYHPLPSKLVNALRNKKNDLPKKVCEYFQLFLVFVSLLPRDVTSDCFDLGTFVEHNWHTGM